MQDPSAILTYIANTRDAAHARLFDFLRIASVSAQPDHAGDCRDAAEWAAAHLRASGFTADVRPTPGHPIVVAHHAGTGGPGAPHLLFYGHYDVQPAEPMELWQSPPFTPVVVEGKNGPRVVARGAVDDKGQVSMWLEALRAWHDTAGGPPVRVTVLLEGEEEVGSANLNAFLADNRAELAADMAVISDTGMWDIDTPALTTRLRGIVYTQITLRAATRDLHSGLFGGSALNPINALTNILGGLHDAQGRVQIPGFYDGVSDVPDALAAQWARLGFDEAEFLAEIGLKTPVGEQGLPGLHRLWARPTADINGIWGLAWTRSGFSPRFGNGCWRGRRPMRRWMWCVSTATPPWKCRWKTALSPRRRRPWRRNMGGRRCWWAAAGPFRWWKACAAFWGWSRC
jgi:acetylornithine deacetylase/succinyl-diaminopimelate desuccinylase-like protein